MTASERLRRGLIRRLRRQGFLRSNRVAGAFAAVPRETFLPGVAHDHVYDDRAFVTHTDADGVPTSSSSQPAVMALMLEQLAVHPGDRVLEIGAGSGYNAALLAYLAGARGGVVSVDIQQQVAEEAGRHLQASGYGGVSVIAGDGALGWPPGAPYDRIIATASCWEIPPAWAEQLTDGGRMLVPLRLSGSQLLVALQRRGAVLESTSVEGGGFMPLQGAFAAPRETFVAGNMRFDCDAPLAEEIRAALPSLLARGRAIRPALGVDRRDSARLVSLLARLALEGVAMVGVHRQSGGPIPDSALAVVTSPASALSLSSPPRTHGTDEALDVVQRLADECRRAGWPLPRVRVERSGESLGPQPVRDGDGWRLRRGEHTFEFTYD